MSFHDTRAGLVPRPWVVDDLDALLDRLCRWATLGLVWFASRACFVQGAAVLLHGLCRRVGGCYKQHAAWLCVAQALVQVRSCGCAWEEGQAGGKGEQTCSEC